MDGPRPPDTLEFERLLRFLNSNLRAGHQWSIGDEYPTALTKGNLHNIRIMTENDEILSHAVVRPLVVKTPVGIFKVACIGSVVTDPSFRNQGLSQKVIEDCMATAAQQECEIAILWTNLFEFYRKFGFELAGSEISFLINREMPVPSTHIKIMKGNKVDPEAILKTYNKHTVCSVRTVDDIRKYLAIPKSNVYTAWGADGQLQAYAIEGKGADLQAYIHEWGGSVPALLPLLNYMFRDQKRPLTLIVPQHSGHLAEKLRQFSITEVPGFLGMVKILNHERLFSKINRTLKETNPKEPVTLEKREDGFYIITSAGKFKTESEADMVRLIFGPHKPMELYSFDPKVAMSLEKALPLPLWVWGWDSV
jgi:GNAT superfamily N-acetyltransferase